MPIRHVQAGGLCTEGQFQGTGLTQSRRIEELEARDFTSSFAPAVLLCQLLNACRLDKLAQPLEQSVYHK